jgi:hypothetical protein
MKSFIVLLVVLGAVLGAGYVLLCRADPQLERQHYILVKRVDTPTNHAVESST